MNWRGRICVVLGVLVLVGLPLWYFRPYWLIESQTTLNIHNAYTETTYYALTVPLWQTSQATFISDALGLKEADSQDQGVLLDIYRPGFTPTGLDTPYANLRKIESLLLKFEQKETRPEEQGKLRKIVTTDIANYLKTGDNMKILAYLNMLADHLERYDVAGTKPRRLVFVNRRSMEEDGFEAPSLQSFENENLLSWQKTLQAPAPSVLTPRKSMRMIDLAEDALPQIPKDMPRLPPLRESTP